MSQLAGAIARVPGRSGGDTPSRFVMENMDAVLNENLHLDTPVEDVSVDTTVIARSVGSVVNPQKNAYLRSVTLRVSDDSVDNDSRWDVAFADPLSVRRMPGPASSSSSSSIPSKSLGSKMIRKVKTGIQLGKNWNKRGVTIASIEGHAALSRIAVGDVVTRINGKKIGPSYNAQRCSDLVNEIYTADKGNRILSIQTGNENGLDTVLEATVLKPHPGATSDDLGLEVWWWRGLCIRAIHPHTMFEHSGLKIDDEMVSINGISLTYNDKITPKEFNRIFQELPVEVTICVRRNKHRYSGEFE